MARPVAAYKTVKLVDSFAEAGYAGNISHAELSDEIENDFYARVGGSWGYGLKLDESSGLLLSAGANVTGHKRFKDLDNISVEALIDYQVASANQFGGLRYGFTSNLAYLVHRQSDIRDGFVWLLGPNLGTRLTDRLDVSGGYRYEYRIGEGTTFDFRAHRLFAHVDYVLSRRSFLFARYTLRQGSVAVTASSMPKLVQASRAVETDSVFNAGLSWRFDGLTQSLEVGHELNFDSRNTLSVSAEGVRTDGDNDNDYERLLLRVQYLYAFE